MTNLVIYYIITESKTACPYNFLGAYFPPLPFIGLSSPNQNITSTIITSSITQMFALNSL
uniref:Uncharacterized protein n=1 Tax=Oryza brachyantha TaxID=4533 RepID=J3M739_ORYBR